MKAALSVSERDLAGLALLRERVGSAWTHGVVLHLGSQVLSFGDRQTALPLSALWAKAPRAT